MDMLVTTDWLAAHCDDPDVRIVDASWFLPADGRDAAAEYVDAHIPGAIFLDLARLADPSSPYPMMLPDDAYAAAHLGALGLSEQDQIIIYDNSPYRSSCRAWWMLARVFGAQRVAILDGGLSKWTSEGKPLATGGITREATRFVVERSDRDVRTKADMRANLETRGEQVIDARGPGRFSGAEPEPREGMASGHIPGSLNLPFARLFKPDGSWKEPAQIAAAFAEAGIDPDRPVVATCGSGTTAAVLLVGALLIGRTDVGLYDGSWSEWGMDPTTPKEVI